MGRGEREFVAMGGTQLYVCAGILQGVSGGRGGYMEVRAELRKQLGEWYTASGKAKAETAMQFCAELLDGGVKLLVFAHHVEASPASCLMPRDAGQLRVSTVFLTPGP